MSVNPESFAQNHKPAPRRRKRMDADFSGPVRPVGEGVKQNSTGNGWNVLIQSCLDENVSGLLLIFCPAQKAFIEDMHRVVKEGAAVNEAFLIAGLPNTMWNGMAIDAEVRVDKETGDVCCYLV